MQYGGIVTADDLFGVVAIEPLSAFIPEQDIAFQVVANNGELGGKLQDVFEQIEGLLGGGYHLSVKEVRFHGKFKTLYGTGETIRFSVETSAKDISRMGICTGKHWREAVSKWD